MLGFAFNPPKLRLAERSARGQSANTTRIRRHLVWKGVVLRVSSQGAQANAQANAEEKNNTYGARKRERTPAVTRALSWDAKTQLPRRMGRRLEHKNRVELKKRGRLFRGGLSRKAPEQQEPEAILSDGHNSIASIEPESYPIIWKEARANQNSKRPLTANHHRSMRPSTSVAKRSSNSAASASPSPLAKQ